jgi:signal transduction histidine kinase
MLFGKKKEKEELDLIAMTVHQLRRPLSSMKLSLQMLAKGEFGSLQSEQKEIIDKTLTQTSLLICIVDDLLNLASTENGMRTQSREPLDVIHLIDSALSLNYQEITRKNIAVEFDRSGLVPPTKLHKATVVMGIQNIIDNAVKYTGQGGWIKISITVKGKSIEVNVQDSGIGIPATDHKSVFQKFFRAHNAMQTTGGSGLGLFIAKKVFEADKGRVWFESQEGAGSTFHIILPIV